MTIAPSDPRYARRWLGKGAAIYRKAVRPAGSHSWGHCQQWLDWLQGDGRLMPLVGVVQDTCQTCHGPVPLDHDGEPYHQCYPCRNRVRGYVKGVVPISYSLSTGLEPLLAQYKDDGEHWLAVPLGCLLEAFLASHLRCIEHVFGHINVITVVPSHRERRGGFDHMKEMVSVVQGGVFADPRWNVDLLVSKRAGERQNRGLDVHAYGLGSGVDVRGKRVLLIDDTFTSGGTIGSAGIALRGEGADVVAVTLGRQLNPDHYDLAKPIAEAQGGKPWSRDTCLLCQ